MAILPSFDDYDQIVRNYVKLCTGLSHVIQANINAPSPTAPYASVLMIDHTTLSTNWSKHSYNQTTDNLDSSHFSQNRMQFRVQVYNTPDAQAILRQLVAHYSVAESELFLKKNNLYFLGADQIRRIDSIQNSKYETRASVEVNFMLISEITSQTNRIVSTNIETDIQSSTIIKENIEVQ